MIEQPGGAPAAATADTASNSSQPRAAASTSPGPLRGRWRRSRLQPEFPMRILRRYSNRKLYDDLLESRYITLEGVARLVRQGEDVHVFDFKTGKDLITVTYAQILVEEERQSPRQSVAGLLAIIRRGLPE
jgi:polyhydroxyalkanoate synthesis repressor PhaR